MNTAEIQNYRKNLILTIIDLQNYLTIEWRKAAGKSIEKDNLWNKDLVKLQFSRFHIVEISSHNEDNFTVKLSVRYGLRSKEASAYGNGHDAFYKRYLSTISFSIEDIADPEKCKMEMKKSFEETYKKENA